MSGNLSDWAENAVLDWLLGGSNPTRPSARYIALHTGAPGDNGASNEVGAGVGYARQVATFSAASLGAASNAGNSTFGPASGAGFGTVTHVSIWDAVSGGNCLWQGALSASILVGIGAPFTIVAGDLDISFTGNLADWARNAAMDWLLGGSNPTRPSARYTALHTGNPGSNGGSNEVGAGVGYARQATTFGAASGGTASQSGGLSFGPESAGGFGTVTHTSIWDAVSGGNCIFQGAFSAIQKYVKIATGDLGLALD